MGVSNCYEATAILLIQVGVLLKTECGTGCITGYYFGYCGFQLLPVYTVLELLLHTR